MDCLREIKECAFFWTPQVMGCPGEPAGRNCTPPLSASWLECLTSKHSEKFSLLKKKSIILEEVFGFFSFHFISSYGLRYWLCSTGKWMESLRLKCCMLMKGASLHLGHYWFNRECCFSIWACFSQVCVVVSGGHFLSSTSNRVWGKKWCLFWHFPPNCKQSLLIPVPKTNFKNQASHSPHTDDTASSENMFPVISMELFFSVLWRPLGTQNKSEVMCRWSSKKHPCHDGW